MHYTVAMNDYIYSEEGNGYNFRSTSPILQHYTIIYDLFESYLTNHTHVYPKIDGRITRVADLGPQDDSDTTLTNQSREQLLGIVSIAGIIILVLVCVIIYFWIRRKTILMDCMFVGKSELNFLL